MVMGVAEIQSRQGIYPELEGARVLVTGLEADHGVEVARAFADAGCRLIVQTPAMSHELEILLELMAQSAEELRISESLIEDDAAAIRFAQGAVKEFGGLDVVVNLARLDAAGLSPDADQDDIEDRIAATLGPAFRITRVVANRMHVTWNEGLVLNVVTQGAAASPAAMMLGQIARAALAALTRREGERLADKAVRVNAIVPADEPGETHHGLAGEPRIAALALHLAGKRGRAHVGAGVRRRQRLNPQPSAISPLSRIQISAITIPGIFRLSTLTLCWSGRLPVAINAARAAAHCSNFARHARSISAQWSTVPTRTRRPS